MNDTKTCKDCGETKPPEQFVKRSKSRGGFDNWCLICRQVYQRNHYHKNKERYQKLNSDRYQERKEHYNRNGTVNARKRLFGIDQEMFELMLDTQQYHCQLCSKEIDKSACVDHDHSNNRVRGLLCRQCNMALGLLKDNTTTLAKAIEYIKRNQ